jgi:hypothetical protein
MNEVQAWVESGKPYGAGFDILKRFCKNETLLSVLAMGDTVYNRGRLERELKAVALPLAPSPKINILKKVAFKADDTPAQYGRLKRDDYPQELWPAFDRQNVLYRNVQYMHARLELWHSLDQGKCKEACKAIVRDWDEINDIYRLLDYWVENKVVLNHKWHDKKREIPKDKAAIVNRRNALRSRISRNKARPDRVAELSAWRQEIVELELLLNG